MKGQPIWDIDTLRSAIRRVDLVRHQSPVPKIPDTDKAIHAAYYAGWDDCAEVIDRLLRKMTGVRS